MPLDTILVLTFVVSLFAVFAVTLAYGEYQTRNLKRDDAAPAQERNSEWRQAA